MNVRGERILIFGDSLSHYGQDSAPEVWEPPSTALVTSSAPGSVLASLLLQQGAQATRTNARVGRSAVSFYDREDATGLLNADRAWRPTKVIVMLGTNDIGRSIERTTAAMAGIKSAYEGMGAEVWAVGPFTYNNTSMNAQASEVAQIMHNVFGARFIDGRPLSIQSGRTGDGVHFGAAAAKQTALNVANAVMTKTTAGDMLGVMALGAAIGIGAFMLFKLFSDPTPKPRQVSGLFGQLLGPPVELVPPIDDEDDDEDWGSPAWMKRLEARKAKRDGILRRALEQNDAVIMTLKGGRRVLLVKSGEMQNTDEGSIRVTEFDDDGPIGHMTRKSIDKLASDIMRDWHPATIEPASEAEVMEMMGTERFAEGSRRVAEVQKHNAGLKGDDAWQIVFPDGSVWIPEDSDPKNPQRSWIYSESTANEFAKKVRHPITGSRGTVRRIGKPGLKGPSGLKWKKIDKGIYEATSPEGTFRIDGNNAGRNRWTITYPDGDYAMVDALAEAKIWAETWRR